MNQPLSRLTKHLVIAATFVLMAAACGDSASTADVGGTPGTAQGTSTTVSPATAGLPLGGGPYPIADLLVTIHPDGIGSAPTATYRISCLGDTATITGNATGSSQSMCLALGRPDVRELILNGAPVDRICTEIYGGPDIATITGTLDGETADFTADRANGCSINDWDSTLIGFLS